MTDKKDKYTDRQKVVFAEQVLEILAHPTWGAESKLDSIEAAYPVAVYAETSSEFMRDMQKKLG